MWKKMTDMTEILSVFNPYAADFFRLFFIHLKLKLLTQFLASSDEKYLCKIDAT